MEHTPERRSNRRVIVGPDHTIRFVARGHAFQNVRITNISATGCFAMVSHRDAALFAQGTILEQFAFEHADLALDPLMAKVMYILGGSSDVATLDFIGVGIQFVGMNADTSKILEDFLASSLKNA